MPVPSSITDLSTTAASNGPAGTDPISNTLDDYLRAIQAIMRSESLNKTWESPGQTATWLSATQFTVPGDYTTTYRVGRRLKATLAGPTTAYCTVSASSFAAGVTTVTVTNDSTALSSPISRIDVGPDILSILGSGTTLFNGVKGTTQAISDSSDLLATTGFVQGVVSPAVAAVRAAYLEYRDQKATGVDGGTFTSGAWQTRTINAEVSDAGGYGTLSSNQITLAAGTYEFEISVPGAECNYHQARLRNITDSATQAVGTSEVATNGAAVQSRSLITGRMTLASPKVFEVQHRCSASKNTVGFGEANGFGELEVYTVARFWRIGA